MLRSARRVHDWSVHIIIGVCMIGVCMIGVCKIAKCNNVGYFGL